LAGLAGLAGDEGDLRHAQTAGRRQEGRRQCGTWGRPAEAVGRARGVTQARLLRAETQVRPGRQSREFWSQGRGRTSLVAEYGFLIESTRRPDLARVSRAWRQALQIQVSHVASRLGSDDPETDSEIILSVIAGLEIDHLSTPLDPSTTQAIRTALRRTITRLGLRGNAARR